MTRSNTSALQLAAAVTLLTLATPILAQNPYASYTQGSNPYSTYTNNPFASTTTATGTATGSSAKASSTSSSSSSNPYSSSSSSGSSYGSYGTSLDYSKMTVIRIAHGVLASAAFVFFFPVGAIIIRVVPSRFTVWIHAGFQVFAYLLFTAAFGLGVWLANQIQFGSFHLIREYHPIIGIVLFAVLILQPILGLLHHFAFKKHQKRVVWSYAHIWLGRVLVTLGIINGGLGLRLANNSKKGEIAYGVVAGIMWLIWMAAAVYGEVKRHRKNKEQYSKEGLGSGSSGESVAQHDNGLGYERQPALGQGYYGQENGQGYPPTYGQGQQSRANEASRYA